MEGHLLGLHSVPSQCTRRENTIARPHRDRVGRMVYMRDVMRRWLEENTLVRNTIVRRPTGSLQARADVISSLPSFPPATQTQRPVRQTSRPATTQAHHLQRPQVRVSDSCDLPRDEPHQPSECPTTHMLAVGYIYVKLLYKFCTKTTLNHRTTSSPPRNALTVPIG